MKRASIAADFRHGYETVPICDELCAGFRSREESRT